MTHVVIFIFAWTGFSLLCLARDRHQRDLFGRKFRIVTAIWLRRAGLSSLLIGLLIAEWSLGWSYGAIEWIGQLSMGALLTLALLSRFSARKSSSSR